MKMVLADSNILIYATRPEHAGLRSWLLANLPGISIISRVEVLGYHRLRDAERAALSGLIDNLKAYYLTPASYEIAIQLRQRQKMSLGDALIAATCLEHGLTLATANLDDFTWIDELRAFNPLDDAAPG